MARQHPQAAYKQQQKTKNGKGQSLSLLLCFVGLSFVEFFVDTSFEVHPDFKSHTGGVLTLKFGALMSLSKKQKLNTQSYTEAELVGADDASTIIL
jgi:hypothetical protein